MSRSVRLRPWQKEALERFSATERPDFLAVATPGAGKTTFALTAAVQDLVRHPERRVVVVAPTQHLKHQWARAASRFDLHLEPQWTARDGRLPEDMHGIVVTYQQVAMQPQALRGVANEAFVVFDELHHAGEERAWGEGVREAFDGAARRLALSGTPFRSDTAAIPFVDYDGLGEAHSDFEYGYGDALVDGGVVRPVYFPRIDGHMEWVGPDGTQYAHTFDDALDHARSGQRLRTALSLSGEWLPAVIDQAHEQLQAIRAVQPHAGGLVIAMDQTHARGIVDLLRRRHGVHPTLVVSDDPTASARIEHFAEGDQPWIVAVRMVSEGVDIPRLRVGRLRHQHGHRAVLPSGHRPSGALDAVACAARRRSSSSPMIPGCAASPPGSPSSAGTRCVARTTTSGVTAPRNSTRCRARWPRRNSSHCSRCSRPSPSAIRSSRSGSARSTTPTGVTIPHPTPTTSSPSPWRHRPARERAGPGTTHHRTRREHKVHLRDENADWARDLVRVTG